MSEQEVRAIISEKFREKLLGSRKTPSFDFVRAISSKIICAKSQSCQFDGRLLKHISGQGPLYVRSTATLRSYSANESSDENETSPEEDEHTIVRTAILDLDKVVENQNVQVIESDDELTGLPINVTPNGNGNAIGSVAVSMTTTPSTSRAVWDVLSTPALPVEPTAAPLVSCPTCNGQFTINEIEEHADLCAESLWHSSEELAYVNLMSSINIPDTDRHLLEECTVNEGSEAATGEITQGNHKDKLTGVLRELQRNVNESVNRLNVQRKSVLADYLTTRKRRPWFNPENKIKVVFVEEPAIDDGGPRREFFTGTLHK